MRVRAIFALAAAMFGAFLLAPAAAQGAGYPPTVCATLSVSTTNPLPGEEITVSGANFIPDAGVHLVLRPGDYDLKTVVADASGSFTAQVKLPNGVFGTHRIVATTGAPKSATCPSDPFVIIHIQKHGAAGSSAGPGGNGGGTAFTGVDVLLLVLAGAVLLGAGVALTRGGKRKHSGHPLID